MQCHILVYPAAYQRGTRKALIAFGNHEILPLPLSPFRAAVAEERKGILGYYLCLNELYSQRT